MFSMLSPFTTTLSVEHWHRVTRFALVRRVFLEYRALFFGTMQLGAELQYVAFGFSMTIKLPIKNWRSTRSAES
jgi:hypothetical protein